MTISILILVLGGLVILVPRLLLRCTHLDEDGHSALYWQRDGVGRVCGWCPYCGRKTRGWQVWE